MNKQNQDRADKVAHVYKKSRKVRSADEVLKRALTDCMQEEANQVQKKMEREGQHAFSKPFIEKMQFVLKLGKQAEEQQRKHVGGDGPVWQPHVLYVWLWQAEAGSDCVEMLKCRRMNRLL